MSDSFSTVNRVERGPSLLAQAGVEFAGTFILVFGIVGAALYATWNPGPIGVVGVALTGGLALAGAIAALGQVSGGHFNPAVSIANLVTGAIRLPQFVVYLAAQFAGGVAATAVHRAAIPEGRLQETAQSLGEQQLTRDPAQVIFNSASNHWGGAGVSLWATILVETVAAIIFITVILSVARRAARLAPLYIGLTLTALLVVLGPLTGGGLNPARSLATAVWGGADAWVWGQLWPFLAAPVLGGLIAGLLSSIFDPLEIEDDWDEEEEPFAEDDEEADEDDDQVEAIANSIEIQDQSDHIVTATTAPTLDPAAIAASIAAEKAAAREKEEAAVPETADSDADEGADEDEDSPEVSSEDSPVASLEASAGKTDSEAPSAAKTDSASVDEPSAAETPTQPSAAKAPTRPSGRRRPPGTGSAS